MESIIAVTLKQPEKMICGKSFLNSLDPWLGALDLTPGSVGLRLYDHYRKVRTHGLTQDIQTKGAQHGQEKDQGREAQDKAASREAKEDEVAAAYAEWDESKHPRHPAGDDQGGEFAPGSGGQVLPREIANAPTGNSRRLDQRDKAKVARDIHSWDYEAAKTIAEVAMSGADRREFVTTGLYSEGKLQALIQHRVSDESMHVVNLASNIRGGGARLMLDAYEQAEKRNLPITLSSTPNALNFYTQKMGMTEDEPPFDLIIQPDEMRKVLRKYGR